MTSLKTNKNMIPKLIFRYFSTKRKEILPSSVVKKYKSNNVKLKSQKILRSNDSQLCQEITKTQEISKEKTNLQKTSKEKTKTQETSKEQTTNSTKSRFNYVNIQMLSESLYKQIFNKNNNQPIPPEIYTQCLDNFKKHDINIQETKPVDDISFKLPKLKGGTLEEHFYNIGEEQARPYRDLIINLRSVPSQPTEWSMKPGWTRYTEGEEPTAVEYPLEDCIVFDVEVCVQVGSNPIIATAVTDKAWYSWVSDTLENRTEFSNKYHHKLEHLIPLESKNRNFHKPRVVIGHNVSYDRARVKEQYLLEKTSTRFVDTMSLHICVSGITSYQRAVLKSGKVDEEDENWIGCSSLNSLAEVYKLYCNGVLDKVTRDIFVDGTLDDVSENFQMLMTYCANDVLATFQVLQKVFPLFLDRFAHPVTFAGMLELGTAYLPINTNWNKYVTTAENTFINLENKIKNLLSKKADETCKLMKGDKYKEDIWMWDQDWSKKVVKSNKSPQEKLFAEYPAWYRKLCLKPDLNDPNWKPTPSLISTSMRITPKILRLTWEGYPLHYLKDHGWGFLIPFTSDLDVAEQIPLKQILEKCPVINLDRDDFANPTMYNLRTIVEENLARKEYYSKKKDDKTQGAYHGTGVWCNAILGNCCYFMRLPHKDGVKNRVGNPLAKDFLTKFSDNVLAGDDKTSEELLAIGRMLTYWRNNRDRILKQMIVWLSKTDLNNDLITDNDLGAIIPQVVVCGTLTRRAVEPTWMTASNAQTERIGSELRGFVQSPPGYNIVGADVDSQELWIASVIGDASVCQMNGVTPFGWMTLSGTKSNGSDMHSVTARAIGISRDQAKVINYARIYGAGQNFAERLLKQFNPAMSENEARSKAMRMFALTKGKRVYRIQEEYLESFIDKEYSNWEAIRIAKAHGKVVNEMFHKPKWIGGTESAMFNRLEEIAGHPNPVTPFLSCRLSRALEPANMSGERFLPTRINWVVQSGAVDYLHLMLVSMKWLMQDQARFVLSFHDEVRYLVPEQHRYQAAFAMHITNLLTRAFCVQRLGLNDLPMSVAFFTSVEVDTVLRKECTQDCKTPSNELGLEQGYGIPKGESLNIYETLKKCNGSFTLE